jgi:hypothetical protein
MANSAVEHSEFYNHFTHYNQYLSDLSLYENWLSNKKYRSLSPAALEVLFTDYSTKLIAKTQIDLILNRKEEIIKNKANLKKLKILFGKIPSETVQNIRTAGLANFDALLANPLSLLDSSNTELSSHVSTAAQTNQIKDYISYLNRIRLSIMGYRMLIDFFFKNNNIQAVSQVVAALNGHASYGFYFTRGFLELSKLLKHTFITDHEILRTNNIGVKEKLSLQLGLRYGILINDSLWGVINYLTYHILIGNGSLGYAGNILTIFLLFSDFLVSLFNIYLAQKKFNEFKDQLNKDFDKKIESLDKEKKEDEKKLLIGEKTTILKEFKDQHNKNMSNLRWAAIYTGTFCLGFIVLFNFLKHGPNHSVLLSPHFFLAGILFIIALQLVDVIRELIIKYKEAGDSKDLKHIAFLEAISRVLTQASIPGLMIATSSLMSAVPALPAWFFIGSMLITSAMLIKTINSLTQYLVLNKEIAHLEKEKEKNKHSNTEGQSTLEQKEDIKDLDAKINEKKVSLASTAFELKNNLLNFTSLSSALSIIGVALAGSSAILPFIAIPVALLFVSLIIKIILNIKNESNNEPSALSPAKS